MKKLIIALQILTLLSQSVHAQELSAPSAPAETAVEIIPEMPKDYQLPDMHYVGPEKKSIFKDIVKFWKRFRKQDGTMFDVKGEVGRYGALWGDEFKNEVYQLQRTAEDKVIYILTLPQEFERAKILEQKFKMDGKPSVIIMIPEHAQAKILERAEMEAAGGFKELWWDTKEKYGKLVNIKQTIADAKKITANQFVKPKAGDLGLVKLSVGSTLVASTLMVSVGAVDLGFAAMMGAMRIAIGGSSLYYFRTINNLFRFNPLDEFKTKSDTRQTLTKLLALGFGIGELYYGVGSKIAGPTYGLTQQQFLFNTTTSGLVEAAANHQRVNRLSDQANHRMVVYSILLGAGISVSSLVGNVGPLVYDSGFIEISSLQVGALSMYLAQLFSYVYLTHKVEKLTELNFLEITKTKLREAISMRQAAEARIEKEKQEAKAKAKIRREQRVEAVKNARDLGQMLRTGTNPICTRLFAL